MGNGDVILWLLIMLACIATIVFFEHLLGNSSLMDRSAYLNLFRLISFLSFCIFIYSLIQIALIALPTM